MNQYYNTLLISEDTIKTESVLDINLSGKYLYPSIMKVQDIQLQETIGTGLYRRIQELIYEDEIENDEYSAYKYILDVFIMPMLQNYVFADLTLQMAASIANAGVVKNSDIEHYSFTSAGERASLRKSYEYAGDQYKLMLQKYLCKNHNLFPEMSPCDCETIAAHLNSAATCNVWLGGNRGKKTLR